MKEARWKDSANSLEPSRREMIREDFGEDLLLLSQLVGELLVTVGELLLVGLGLLAPGNERIKCGPFKVLNGFLINLVYPSRVGGSNW